MNALLTTIDSINPLWFPVIGIAGYVLRKQLVYIIGIVLLCYVLWQWVGASTYSLGFGIPLIGGTGQGDSLIPSQNETEIKELGLFNSLKSALIEPINKSELPLADTQNMNGEKGGWTQNTNEPSQIFNTTTRKTDNPKSYCIGRAARGYEKYNQATWEQQVSAQGLMPTACEGGCIYQAVQFTVDKIVTPYRYCSQGEIITGNDVQYTVTGLWETTGAGCGITIEITAHSESADPLCDGFQ